MKQILILEDDVRLARQWQRALSDTYRVFVTHGATQALSVFEKQEIDLCIVDFLVRRDGVISQDGGISFLGRLRLLMIERGLSVAILGVSGLLPSQIGVDPESHLRVFGAECFLRKPFTDEELSAEVDRMLAE